MKALILVDQIYEDLELHYPRLRLHEEEIEVIVAGKEKGERYIGKWGYPIVSGISFSNVSPSDYDILVIPGGFAPDKIRQNKEALEIVQSFDREKKVIAFICHGGWVPISAGILKGKKVTGYIAIKDDLTNAGATFLDQAVVVDGHIISSRKPPDLPDFMKAIFSCVQK